MIQKIDNILNDSTHPLNSRLVKSIEVIQNTIRLYIPSHQQQQQQQQEQQEEGQQEGEGHIFISFNGGKDATVVLHLLHYILMKQEKMSLLGSVIKIIYFDNPQQFPEIKEFIHKMLYDLNVEPVTFTCCFKDGVEDAVRNYQMKAVLMGVRRGDPHTEEAEHFHPSTSNYPPFMRVYPILNWNYEDG